MENKKSSYTIIALILLLDGKELSYIGEAKNSNQYFGKIKNNGIELIEVKKGSNKYFHRRLNQTIENIDRAKKYLKRLQNKI